MKKVLIIEDNPTNARLIKECLKLHGYAVLEAATARYGITLAREKQPDLIIMDIGLPGMDGLAATQILKSDPVTAAIPVLALTAYAMAGDADRCLHAGCNAYLPKPVRIDNFIATVKRFVPS